MADYSEPKATESEPRPIAERDGSGREKIVYAPEEVLARYEAMLESVSFQHEIAELGCGLDSLFNRSRSLAEMKAMHAALWKLALERSFPDDAENFFRYFMEYSPTLGKGKNRAKMQQRINIYVDLSASRKVADFTPIAQYMADTLAGNLKDQKTVRLKLSLAARRFYQSVFDQLI